MRDIPVGNGSLLVNFDDKYQIRDIYFPHVGQENHTEGFPFRFGIWVDGQFSWIFSNEWTRTLRYLPDTLVTDVRVSNATLGIELNCEDTVAGRENIYLRKVVVKDTSGSRREVRVFLHHDFRIYENKVGDTAFYDPDTSAIVHYKKHRYFLINSAPYFNEFATGRKAFRNSEGTWRDAEDGQLYCGAITEGSVDSTIAVHGSVDGNGEFQFFYWIAAGTSLAEVAALNAHVETRRAKNYFLEAVGHWREWIKPPRTSAMELPAAILDLYRRSLLIVNTQIDHHGAIIAANDHDVTERATDHYSYLWPRDGAFVANAMDRAGYPDISRKFFELCTRIVDHKGYFLQKYNPDGSVGSGWHAHWDSRTSRRLVPIQEDETALVLWALGEHHRLFPENDLSETIYDHLVVRCADFMTEFRDPLTGLPKPSWNLWEDRLGVHTFTCSAVVAGLRSAARFAAARSDMVRAERYSTASDQIIEGMRSHLFESEKRYFLRALGEGQDGILYPDATLDASLFAVFYLGCFPPDDPMVVGTMDAIEERLVNHTPIGGVMRFEEDGYMRGPAPAPPNSWIITTLWLAEYKIAGARSIAELSAALDLLNWTVSRALPSGVLAEQIDPLTGDARSVSPLTWSHSTFIAAVDSYIAKAGELSGT